MRRFMQARSAGDRVGIWAPNRWGVGTRQIRDSQRDLVTKPRLYRVQWKYAKAVSVAMVIAMAVSGCGLCAMLKGIWAAMLIWPT